MLHIPYLREHKNEIIEKLEIKNFEANEIIEKLLNKDIDKIFHNLNITFANKRSICVMNNIHVSTGIFIKVIPGDRILSTVTIKLIAPTSEAIPVICKPIAKKSIPLLGEKRTPVFGEYANHPPSGAFSHHPPMNIDVKRKIPPPRKTQKLNAFSLGKATSRAPICRGMR